MKLLRWLLHPHHDWREHGYRFYIGAVLKECSFGLCSCGADSIRVAWRSLNAPTETLPYLGSFPGDSSIDDLRKRFAEIHDWDVCPICR